MSETKEFSLRTILYVTTGRLLTKSQGPDDNGIGDMYEILEWMTSESPFTHSLGRFAKECKPWLLKWFPELIAVDGLLPVLDVWCKRDGAGDDTVERWVDEQVVLLIDCKQSYCVPKIPEGEHERKDPLAELQEMVGDKPVITVVAKE